MERIIVLTLVFASFGFLIWEMINLLKGKDSCSGCGNYKECLKDKKYLYGLGDDGEKG